MAELSVVWSNKAAKIDPVDADKVHISDGGVLKTISLAVLKIFIKAGLTKSDVGLGNCDNTADTAKPISTATQTALDGKSGISHSHSIDSLLPAQTGNSGKVLKTDGTNASWQSDNAGAGGEAFPVGSLYLSVVSTNPSTLLGYGTWSAFGTGRTLVGIDATDPDFDTAQGTGGAKAHTLTEAEMPAHTHIQNPHSHVQGVNSATTGGTSGYAPDTSTNNRVNSGYSTSDATAVNQSTGGGQAHSIMNPYIVVYMWRRDS